MRVRIAFAMLACLLAVAVPARAQTVTINPSTVVFEASSDHSTIGLDGQPLLTRYELHVFLEGATEPVMKQDLGKPQPDQAGEISVTNRAWFLGLANNARHIAKALAIGPHGQSVSPASDPFGNVGPPTATGRPVMRR